MTETQRKESNGTATRVTAIEGAETANDGINPANSSSGRLNGAKSATPTKTASADNGDKENTSASKSGKKRKKVNHACIYCRRSHMTCDLDRPCTRCVKRNIGHLCHDEPREPAKKSKSELSAGAENEPPQKIDSAAGDPSLGTLDPTGRPDAGLELGQLSQSQGTASIVQPMPVAAPQASSLTGNAQALLGYGDWNFGSQNNFLHDMHNFHPQYSFSTSEVSNEYNLLNDFLTHSMLEDGGMYPNEESNQFFQQSVPYPNTMQTLSNSFLVPNPQSNQAGQMGPPTQAALGNAISRPASGFPIDKARETFYLAAADPAGNEPPQERMKKLMRAKYDAGLLKPFNYVQGYARLLEYMNKNLAPQSRIRIVKQLERFRPIFRERMHPLTDMQLIYVEVDLESKLMEYDRVFASMAIPACCWRRTGEICRGNNEMAKILGVPLERLRDGKIAIHEIFAENSLVSYWEKFSQIAFDSSQKAILTSCSLRTRDPAAQEPELRCCFSFTIRRDNYSVPSLIVGNFLPIISLEK